MPDDLTRTEASISLFDLLRAALAREAATPVPADPDADLLDLGLLDSQRLLDIILEVEHASGRMFDAERIDFDTGVSLRKLAAAFGET